MYGNKQREREREKPKETEVRENGVTEVQEKLEPMLVRASKLKTEE